MKNEPTATNYQSGFGNEHASEAHAGALPRGQNSPQQAPYGLYAEQLSGTAFTAPRSQNLRSWLYRIQPSVVQGRWSPYTHSTLASAPFDGAPTPPDQLRWDPLPETNSADVDFIDGLHTWAGNGDTCAQQGIAVHLYACTRSMGTRYFYNADGEMLLVPQLGALTVATEFGKLELAPGEIALLPRGIKFKVDLLDTQARGYVCENYGAPFQLPELGPIGANGLANARDFLAPVAAYDDLAIDGQLISKFAGRMYRATIQHSPLDVVAWHGNYAPYKYSLERFMAINTVSFDHPDPSIFTVLTSPSEIAGTANADFVIFPPRWMVAENTFRPPWYHRNVMSEFMGLIHGVYDAKQGGFLPGGCSLHNCMTPHGPDVGTFDKASSSSLDPAKIDNTMAFMFESRHIIHPTPAALASPLRQADYVDCWQGLARNFERPR